MATAVVLQVTPKSPIDPDGRYALPSDVASLLTTAGQMYGGALSRSGDGPWRFCLRITGRDRIDVGRRLHGEVRTLGYDSDLLIGR